jgi:hypothetical protein
MGADIHSILQIKGINWKTVNAKLFPDYFSFREDRVTHTSAPFSERNYELFAFLADVRNYGAIKPLDLPRGLPTDYQTEKYGDLGDHSFSWLSLEELVSFNYDEKLLQPEKVNLSPIASTYLKRSFAIWLLCPA